MRLGIVGLGRMGANMACRLLRGGHEVVGFDRDAAAVNAIVTDGAVGAHTPAEFIAALPPPRGVWLMVPDPVVDAAIASLSPQLIAGDVVIDGGNSNFHEGIRRAKALSPAGIDFVDVGTSGGVWGPRAWLLLDDRRSPRGVRSAHTDFRNAGARRRRGDCCRTRLRLLRAQRRRTLRQDGPQRDRVQA